MMNIAAARLEATENYKQNIIITQWSLIYLQAENGVEHCTNIAYYNQKIECYSLQIGTC